MNRLLTITFAVSIALGFTACSKLEEFAETGDISMPKLNLPLPKAKQEANAGDTITILHFNDWHSQHESIKPAGEPEQGNIARISTVIDQARRNKGADHVLLVTGGDSFQGSFFYNAWKGSAEVMAHNYIGLDAAPFGNHEFDLGPKELARALAGGDVEIAGKTYHTEPAMYKMLGTNVDAFDEPELAKLFTKTAIVTKGGQQYGLLGVVTETTKTISSPGEGIRFLPYVKAVQDGVKELKSQGVNRIILMSHSGYTEDVRYAAELSGVDVIIAGHDNALLGDADEIRAMGLPEQAELVSGPYPTVVKGKDGNNILIVSALTKGRWLGNIDVTFDKNGVIRNGSWKGNPIFIRGCDMVDGVADCSKEVAKPDPKLTAKVKEYYEPIKYLAEEVLGKATVDFGGRENLTKDVALTGDLVADVILDFTKESDKTDIAMTNRGGIRADINKGVVKFKDVNAVLPFNNSIVVIEMTGDTLIGAIDHTLSLDEETSYGAFPHLSNMTVHYCEEQPCQGALRGEGGFVTEAMIDGEPIDLKASYRVATNSYMANGGDFYAALKEICEDKAAYCRDTGVYMKDVLADWFRNHSPVTGSSERHMLPH